VIGFVEGKARPGAGYWSGRLRRRRARFPRRSGSPSTAQAMTRNLLLQAIAAADIATQDPGE